MCEIGVGFSFAALSVFRLRRAEAASAVWIPHWHSEPCESQGTRAAKGYVNGNLGFRNLLGARRGLRGQFSVQSDNRFSGRGGGGGEPPQGVVASWGATTSVVPSPEFQSQSNLVSRLLLQ